MRILTCAVLAAMALPAENWPSWRGPGGQWDFGGEVAAFGMGACQKYRLEDGDSGARPVVADRVG
jgi:hypothetical protein